MLGRFQTQDLDRVAGIPSWMQVKQRGRLAVSSHQRKERSSIRFAKDSRQRIHPDPETLDESSQPEFVVLTGMMYNLNMSSAGVYSRRY